MRKIDWLHHTSSYQFKQYLHEIELIHQPLNDECILAVQDKLLSQGFQYLKVNSVQEGRQIIGLFLQSLSLYQSVGCLTLEAPLQEIASIYDHLELCFWDKYLMQEYFINFQFDFMWIEATEEMLSNPRFEQIRQAMIQSVIDQHMTILVLVYE